MTYEDPLHLFYRSLERTDREAEKLSIGARGVFCTSVAASRKAYREACDAALAAYSVATAETRAVILDHPSLSFELENAFEHLFSSLEPRGDYLAAVSKARRDYIHALRAALKVAASVDVGSLGTR